MSASINPVYRIAKWRETFETADSRKHKALSWVSLPIDRQSSGYQSLIDHGGDDSPALYGAWCVLIGIAAACPVRGTLANSRGQGMTIERIARLAHMPVETFQALFEWAKRPEIGWIEVVSEGSHENTSDVDRLPIDCQSIDNQSAIELPNLTLPNPTLPNNNPSSRDEDACSKSKPVKKKASSNRRTYTDDFDRWWLAYPRKVEKPNAFTAFKSATERIRKDGHPDDAVEWLIGRTKLYANSVKDTPEKFIKHPASWLNADRFNDEPILETTGIGAGQTYDPDASFGDDL